MKKIGSSIAFICLLFIASSCKRNSYESTLSIPELSANLQTSQAFSRYMLFTARLERGIIAGKYNVTTQTHDNLAKLISSKKVESIDQITKDFTAAGVDNAKEFVFLNLNKSHYHHLLMTEFPQLKTMAPGAALKLMNDVYYKQMHHKEPPMVNLLRQRRANLQKRAQITSLNKTIN